MALIDWSALLSCGIAEIDEQHKKLIHLINRIDEAAHLEKGPEVLGGLLAELLHYTVYHFGYEEQLMGQYRYAEFAAHKREHARFTNHIVIFRKRFATRDALLDDSLLNFMRDWLTDHIMSTDKKLGQALGKQVVENGDYSPM